MVELTKSNAIWMRNLGRKIIKNSKLMGSILKKLQFPGMFLEDGKKMVYGGLCQGKIVVFDIQNNQIIEEYFDSKD